VSKQDKSPSISRFPAVVAVVAVLVTGAPAVPSASAYGVAAHGSAISGLDRVTDLPSLERRLLGEINALRRQQGLAPLRASKGLAAAAREQSMSMAENGFFGHESPGGSPFWKRVESMYPKPAAGSWSVGENLVWRSPRLSAERALQLWLDSPPHRQNLLEPTWREIGIAAVHAKGAPGVYGGQDVTILTADFGVRR